MSFDTNQPLQLLGGLSAAQFMKQYWQRKPLLVRQAIPQFVAPVSADRLFALAGQEEVESRLIQASGDSWSMKKGPFTKRQLPSRKKPKWTILVQGVDLHDEAGHDLLQQFSFVPQARLDDLMISHATDGGGVGPHFDSYDVFLLQAQGQRHWRIGRQKNLDLQEGVPLRILKHFEPEQDWVLEPGDMLYLPPKYAHDGIAVGDGCMTYSIGFRVPQQADLAQSVLEKVVEELYDEEESSAAPTLYKDAGQPAVSQSGEIPASLQDFALEAVLKTIQQKQRVEQALGEYLTEPKQNVVFDADGDDYSEPEVEKESTIRLSKKTRMMYDKNFVYINGESYRCAGKDATAMRELADERVLSGKAYFKLSETAQEIVLDWISQGWVELR